MKFPQAQQEIREPRGLIVRSPLDQVGTESCVQGAYESVEVRDAQAFQRSFEQQVVVDREDLQRLVVVRPCGPSSKAERRRKISAADVQMFDDESAYSGV